ncbi:MAG: lytic murein transglycosylase [Deltaproteobacteria bacterium]|nr:MAG: lytic murein transglycosylase [Deltaproteobacteria bacterium]
MKGWRIWKAVFCLFFLGIICTTAGLVNKSAAARVSHELQRSLLKHQDSRPAASQLRRLQRYNYLINYFCSFAYFQKGRTVNADFLRALIIAESNVRPRAISSKGARGLTQILYSTGRQAARELVATHYRFRYVNIHRLSHLRKEDLDDPAINLLLASYLIAKYNIQFNGKLDLVVAAWNAGGKSIKNNTPPHYPETLDLIGKVNSHFLYFIRRNSGKG